MEEQYISNKIYETYYEKLGGLRCRIARDLPVKSDMHILDVGTGYAYFAIEVAKLDSSIAITAIDISEECMRKSQKNIKKSNFQKHIKVARMDATNISFGDNEFDMVINFTGLEDIHMTRGREGVEKTFYEVARVLKTGCFFCFVVMLSDEVETEAQKVELELFSYICDSTWLCRNEYKHFAEVAGLTIVGGGNFYTKKKLTAEQARYEIEYAVDNVPKIYNKKTPSLEEIWEKYGERIEKYGLGHYSKVTLITAQKVKEV